jgi:hypothetical protein
MLSAEEEEDEEDDDDIMLSVSGGKVCDRPSGSTRDDLVEFDE